MKNPKTTLVAILAAVAGALKIITGIDVPPDVQIGFVTVVLFLIGFFAKDGNK